LLVEEDVTKNCTESDEKPELKTCQKNDTLFRALLNANSDSPENMWGLVVYLPPRHFAHE
jgi:hypothetical protein